MKAYSEFEGGWLFCESRTPSFFVRGMFGGVRPVCGKFLTELFRESEY